MQDGETPLHLNAKIGGHKDICSLLLNTKEINVKSVTKLDVSVCIDLHMGSDYALVHVV